MDNKPPGIELSQPDRFRSFGSRSENGTLAKVEDRPEPAKVESAKPSLDQKIVDAKKQGREFLANGLLKIKEKMADLKKRIKALPKAIAELATAAVAEAFAVPARTEKAVDALTQKMAAAEANMKLKIQEANDRFEKQRQDLLRRAQETINQIRDKSANFFNEIGESQLAASRKQEKEEYTRLILEFLNKCYDKKITVTDAMFKNYSDAILRMQKDHRQNASLLYRFAQSFGGNRIVLNMA